MYAHYFAGQGRKELIITETPSLRGRLADGVEGLTSIFRVEGKRQARAIAKAHNAQPWNF